MYNRLMTQKDFIMWAKTLTILHWMFIAFTTATITVLSFAPEATGIDTKYSWVSVIAMLLMTRGAEASWGDSLRKSVVKTTLALVALDTVIAVIGVCLAFNTLGIDSIVNGYYVVLVVLFIYVLITK